MVRPMKLRGLLVLLLVAALATGGFFWWKRQAASSPAGLGKAAYAYTEAILAKGPRPAGSPGLKAVQGYVTAELEKTGWSVKEQAFKRNTPAGEIGFVNLRARFAPKGGDPWKTTPAGILCAHLDSKLIPGVEFLGADDAASACAAIMEMARFLAKHRPEQAAGLELVFFDGEEAFGHSITTLDGLYGSREYAGLWRNQAQKPRFGILLDMIGHKNLRIQLPADSPKDLKERVLQAAELENAGKHFGVSPGVIIDDHVPLNAVGIPTIDLIADFSNTTWWHNHAGGKDDLSIISAESLDLSMRVTLRTLERLLGKNATKP
jgi:glutaminyl-peptide cyclotransferase